VIILVNLMYECKTCDYQTKIKADYSKHMITKKHMKKKKELRSQFKCNGCNKTFASSKNLDKHNDKFHVGAVKKTVKKIIDDKKEVDDNNFIIVDDEDNESLSDFIMTCNNEDVGKETNLDSIFELPKMAELLKVQNENMKASVPNMQNIQNMHNLQDDDIGSIRKQIELLNEHIKDLHEESVGLQVHISNLYKSHIDLLERVKHLSEKNDYRKLIC
jgi:hypothetical protein